MKRKILFIVLTVVFASTLVLAACSHTHTFSDEWMHDQTYHWHPATCEHTDEVGGKEKHEFVNGVCKCGLKQGEIEISNNGFTWSLYEGEEPCTLPTVPTGAAAKDSIQIHYKRSKASEYKDWSLWLWTESGSVGSSGDGVGWAFNYQDDYGAVALYSLEDLGKLQGGAGGFDGSEPLGFIVRNASWNKDVSDDRFWTLGTKDSNNYYHLYLLSGDSNLYETKPEGHDDIQYTFSAAFQSETKINITAASPISHIKIYEGNTVLAETDTDQTVKIRYDMTGGKKADLSKDYKVEATFSGATVKEASVGIIALYDTANFANAYNYEGDDLGAVYSETSTTFKVWSPVSTSITLNIYNDGSEGDAYKIVPMTKGDKGVWSATVDGDLAAKYYTYTVVNSSYPQGAEIVDPYAKSAGLNGLRGEIVNFDETNPDGWNEVQPIPYDKNELVVWETHVADVTSSATWNGPEKYRKKFLGMIEENTTYTKGDVTVSTGFDHIKELGVNAVQLVPIFDQANDEANPQFNWGYNPLNYNVLEGAYSTDASDGYVRIREFKELVKAFNCQQINIIMDVVYNHVNAAIGSNFDVLCPGYYFRYNSNGELSSGSGCGNDTASDHYMFRKFMIDSVCFWAKEYKLAGFRFDLMGLHDLETMNQLTAALKKINPNIVVYGEPWDMSTATDAKLAIQANGKDYVGFGQFNDKMRDALIKGGMNGATQTGWVTGASSGAGDANAIVDGLLGVTASSPKITDPAKTVNYVTCHDNYTLWDRIWATGQLSKNNASDYQLARQMAVLANSIVMTSNGVSFMLAGEEFLRSKEEQGATGEAIHNSYNASYQVNELNYALKIKFAREFEIYQKLIAFKTQKLDLDIDQITSQNYTAKLSNNNGLIEVNIVSANGTSWRIFYANFNVGRNGVNVDLDGYNVYLDTLDSYEEGSALISSTLISRYQVIIAQKAA